MVVLITGASTGLGRLTAELLAQNGHRVFATMRDPGGRNAAPTDALKLLSGVTVLELDVTSEGSVTAAVGTALQDAGHIDCVVNNAGFGSFGLCEAFTPEQWHTIFDTNLIGCVRVNRAVLPSMRTRRTGLLLHVTSIAGRMPIPYLGPYCATKWALECYAEQLRLELAPIGVDSVVVEPGKFETEIYNKRFSPPEWRHYVEEYGDADSSLRFRNRFFAEMEAQDPKQVAEAIGRLILAPFGSRPFRTPLGKDATCLEQYNKTADELRLLTADMVGVPELAVQAPQKSE